jgi:hypothetical protein
MAKVEWQCQQKPRYLSLSYRLCLFVYLNPIGLHGLLLGFLYYVQIYNLLFNGAISKHVVRKHFCGAIIQ